MAINPSWRSSPVSFSVLPRTEVSGRNVARPGRKVRITGKGRCNVTNARPPEEFASQVRTNADFFAPAFAEFNNRATIRFFERRGVKLDIERGERVFPHSGKAWDIANALLDYCVENGVKILYNTQVTGVLTLAGHVFGVRYRNKRGFERKVEAPQVIVATGGLSYPATGSTGDGYRFAADLVALDTLRELDLEWRGGMALTYLAVCLLSIDRPIRLCAANLWGELVEKDLIDNVALGRVLGKIQALEWAPAQRVSGLVVEMLINRSSFHNKELSVLFVSFLSCLPENPVKDLKRLLEVFAELQTVNNWPKVTYAPLLCLLETWKKNSKLTEVIESLY